MKIAICLIQSPFGGEPPYGVFVNAYTRRSQNGNTHIVRAHWRKKRRRDDEIRHHA
jgi:hypothetical protein